MRPQPKEDRTSLHFLVYAPRSGSTFFADALSRACPNLLVVPEFRTVEFLLARPEAYVKNLRPRELARLMAADRQLIPNLGIQKTQQRLLAEQLAGGGSNEIISGIVAAYAGDSPLVVRKVLLKLSGALKFPKRLPELSPEVRVIEVYRDGRGVVNSLLTTPKAYFPSETMGRDDVVYCANVWNRHVAVSQDSAFKFGARLLRLRYEDLLEDLDSGLKGAAHLLDLPNLRTGQIQTPYTIGDTERPLHPRVGLERQVERATAWETELGSQRGVVAELLMRDELRLLGYKPYFVQGRPTIRNPSILMHARLRHAAGTANYFARRLWQHRFRGSELYEHCRARFMAKVHR